MAKHVLYDASVVLNSVDLSDHVEKVSYVTGVDGEKADAMGDTQMYEMPGLIKISDIKIDFYADFASNKVYATIQPLVTNRSTVTLTVKPTSSSPSATNPAFSISVFVKSAPFVDGQHGTRHMAQAVFGPAGVQSIAIT